MNRQSRALLTILIVAGLFLPYWWLTRGSDRTTPRAEAKVEGPRPARGGSVVASTRTEPRSFNRIVQAAFTTELMSMLTLGKLVRINRTTQEVEPWLAERWSVSPDARVYTLTLRSGVNWSDGTPFTSADVVFAFEAIYDPRNASPLAETMQVAGKPLRVEAPSAGSVVITFPEVFAPGVRLLDNVPIVPRHKLLAAQQAGTFATAWAADTAPADLASIGPFVLAEYLPGERLIFARNEKYWRSDDRGIRLPYLDRLTLELVPEEDAELVRLQSGATDFTQSALRTADLETLRLDEQRGALKIEELGVSRDADAFVFNLRPEHWTDDPRAAWLNRLEFRQALSHAIDREAFADTVFLGNAVPIHGPVTPGNKDWFWPSVPRYEHSPAKARALLEGLGLRNRDEDEWLEDEAGNDVRFSSLVFRSNAVLERSASVLHEDLRQFGIAMDIIPLDVGAVVQRVTAGDFDSALMQFIRTDSDPAGSFDFWMSSGKAHLWHASQKTPATDWERQIDVLMTKQAATLDVDERKRLFNEVQRIFAANLPVLFFAAPRVHIATSARLLNVQPSLSRPQVLWSADTLAVAPSTTTR